MKIDIDVTDVETGPTSNGWTALPAGDYRIVIMETELRETRGGDGLGLVLTINTLGTEHGGVELREWLNVKNPNETAEAIAKKRLAEILDAVGISRDDFDDTSQIEGKPLMAAIGCRRVANDERRAKYGDRNGNENHIRFFGPIKSQTGDAMEDRKVEYAEKTNGSAEQAGVFGDETIPF